MITGEVRNRVDRLWDAFWSGGISNPLEVIEQITYLLFIRRLDVEQTLKEKRARFTGGVIEDVIFLPEQYEMRWSRFKHAESAVMYATVEKKVFPFLRELRRDGSTYATHMQGSRFTIPTPALLSKAVDTLDAIETLQGDSDGKNTHDTNGDLYEYLLIPTGRSR